MVRLLISAGASGRAEAILKPRQSTADSTDSFAGRLATALEEAADRRANGSKLKTAAVPAPGQDAGARQFVGAADNGSLSAASAKQVGLMSIPRPPAKSTPEPAEVPPAGDRPKLANGKPVTNEYEAYWASQPPQVQALMNLPTEAERLAMAHELADQGYLIDVPIMVWRWDPLSTMVVRRNQGFTWVPSANQNPVQVMPGLSYPGLASYDPKNPPPGAIKVSTDFAKGFEDTCPWLSHEDLVSL
jgi:hypothetical protein